MATLYYKLVNFMKTLCIVLLILLAFTPFVLSQSASEAELKSIQNLISNTEKLTKNKSTRNQLKRSRKHLDRVRELWQLGAVPNSLGLLLEVRSILYRNGSLETQPFQQNLRFAMKRLWPFLLKSNRFRSDVHRISGITYVRILVPEGAFTMSYPEDTKPGEVVSGRIQASPPQTASLYLLTVLGAPVVADGSLHRWQLPESFDLILNDQWGNEIVRTNHKIVREQAADPFASSTDPQLQVEKQPKEAKQNIEIPHLRFEISSRVKAGGYLIVKGPFDGDFSNTTVAIGKYQGHIVTESPGRVVLLIHPQMAGDWTILINEAEHWARCRVRVQNEEVDPYSTISVCTPPERVRGAMNRAPASSRND
jgi:hypothetical protein